MQWDSKRYLQYSNERTQPAIDLAARLVFEKSPDYIADIGCGPGNSTIILKSKFPEAKVIGFDNSRDMLEKAKTQYGSDIEFQFCDVSTGLANIKAKFDIVFSNACLQWVPDHERILPELFDMLNTNGLLAVQIPKNWDSPLYKAMYEVVNDSKWNFNKADIAYNSSLEPEKYFDIISALSSDFNIWESVYYHRMKSHSGLVDWIKGTMLRPYLNLLDDEHQKELEQEIVSKLASLYPVQRNGEIIYRFRRLFFTVRKI